MRHIHFSARNLFTSGVFAFLTLLFAYGCASEKRPLTTTAPTVPAAVSMPAKGNAQIWSENCAHCHNLRPPDWYSDAQWEVAMQHMRIRGYLTGSEQRAIEELLKASN